MAPALLASTPLLAQTASPTIQLAPVEVVATSPLGAGQSTLNVPSETQSLDAQQIGDLNQSTITEDMARRTPGVSTTNASGSPLSQSLDFRGQTASPVPGTPQGLSVYMNGVRINESYGDIVNWDLIPTTAIETAQIVTGNPIFGLNALAGAVVMNMKNGFTWQGTEINLQGGTDYTTQDSLQYGLKKGDWAYYVAIEGVRSNGFRYYGQSDVERAYGDVGYRANGNEVHLSMTGGADGLGVASSTPVDLIAQQGYAAIWTNPQTTTTSAEMITLSDVSNISSTLTFNGNVYFRNYAQAHVDGNASQFFHCAAGGGYLCNAPGSPTTIVDPAPGQPNGQPMGEIDRNWTATKTIGTTAQLTDTDQILGHKNSITAGVSVDNGWTHFGGDSQLGSLPSSLTIGQYPGAYINYPQSDVSPVNLSAQNTYLGIYVLDDFNVTDRLALHAGARFNDAFINLTDLSGTNPNLNANNNFNRINPVAGVTFKITPDISAYASYSEANRAPTPLELGCASPTQPCMIDNFLAADPPLKQIVSRTVETGLKGSNHVDWLRPGQLDWSVSAYRTENFNDIYSVPSPTVIGFGYYTNAGDTLRQGVDAGATYTTGRWDVYANYSYIQAVFLTPLALSSPYNPSADASGNIQVLPGNNLPGIPHHKFKIGFDYTLVPNWKVGADLVYRSSQYYFGDENNSMAPMAGFATVNLRTSYQINKNFQVYGLINNALDSRGAVFGALYNTASTTNQITGNPVPGLFASNNPRSITISAPFEAFAGVKMTF
ncbi:TonB-dependent receptor [Methylovirgula sp. HY1]|uniref:TonB-dependent receptor n=1 Tax=Methylovirgula sp. HY1 TaxID=2822761 RepID=UPI001C5B89AF|nr:TonB-dependent receptor [Methylovirgula sp. HY1]